MFYNNERKISIPSSSAFGASDSQIFSLIWELLFSNRLNNIKQMDFLLELLSVIWNSIDIGIQFNWRFTDYMLEEAY